MTQYPFSYNLVKRLKYYFLLDVYMKYAFVYTCRQISYLDVRVWNVLKIYYKACTRQCKKVPTRFFPLYLQCFLNNKLSFNFSKNSVWNHLWPLWRHISFFNLYFLIQKLLEELAFQKHICLFTKSYGHEMLWSS